MKSSFLAFFAIAVALSTGVGFSQPIVPSQEDGLDLLSIQNYAAISKYVCPEAARSSFCVVDTLLAQEDAYTDTASAPNVSAWSTVRGDRFSIRFPQGSRRESARYRGLDTVSWTGESDDPLHLFKVNMVEYPTGAITQADPDEILFGLMKGQCDALQAQPVQKRRIQNTNSPGCTFKVPTANAEWDFMIRLHGDTAYIISVCSMIGEADDGYRDAFFDSFTLF